MKTYYCDASQHRDFKKLGIGIVTGDDRELYYEFDNHDCSKNIHEIKAIRITARLAMKKGHKNIVIINDDRNMVEVINQAIGIQNIRIRKGNLKKKQEFVNLVRFLKENGIRVESPKSQEERRKIGVCHRLSRSYIS